VAQRTGAERFLAAPLAKSASAGVALALALAALLLCGCGSSEEEDPAAAAGETTAAPAAPAAGSPAPGTAASAGQGAQSKAPGAPGTGAPGAPGAQGQAGQGQKQGPRIAQPQGPREQGPSAAELAEATVADISLKSPAIVASGGNPGSLSPTYTCDGTDSWPALEWSGVPAGSAELALYVMNVQPVEEKLFVDWAVAGIDPGLDAIAAGELPKGAIVATNGFGKRGYSICPAGRGEIYMFALYALPSRLGLRPGFDAREARARILDVSGNVGLLPALYAHG
jgi:phosphatidylethanolamine-binding protein (PEBP) family uncharacterized protein